MKLQRARVIGEKSSKFRFETFLFCQILFSFFALCNSSNFRFTHTTRSLIHDTWVSTGVIRRERQVDATWKSFQRTHKSFSINFLSSHCHWGGENTLGSWKCVNLTKNIGNSMSARPFKLPTRIFYVWTFTIKAFQLSLFTKKSSIISISNKISVYSLMFLLSIFQRFGTFLMKRVFIV